MSRGFKDLINKLLDKNPDTRIKLKDIVHDPWINQDSVSL
jgi:serine/threonine protein kinase